MVNIKKTLQGFVKTLKKLSIIVLLGWIVMLIFTHKLSIFISCFHSEAIIINHGLKEQNQLKVNHTHFKQAHQMKTT